MKMRHLIVIVTVICAVIGDGWAQNRGSARYVPPEGFDDDITRAPRPTRGAAVRRQRLTTKAPEPAVVEDELKTYQPSDSPARNTGRRVPQRGSPQQLAPPPPPHVPIEDSVSRYATSAEEIPQAPAVTPEGRPQGTRRRRPKKRRRPQNAVPKVTEEPEKQVATIRDEENTSISELLNEDKKRTGLFQNNPVSRSSPSDSIYQPESNQPSELQNNAAGPPYYRPQPTINRLPVGDSEVSGNSKSYLDSSQSVPDGPASYISNEPSSSVSNDASYVPILTPIRVPAEGASRLPPQNYPDIQNKDNTRLSTNPNIPLRGHSSRPSLANSEEIIRNTDAKPVHNIIPQPNEPSLPVPSHSEVRLPENAQPVLSSQYIPPSFDSSEESLASNIKSSEDVKESPSSSNRLPNPSEIHYESVYPEFSDDQMRGIQRIAVRRQEPEEPTIRSPLPSYNIPRRDIGTKPQEYDNDAEVDRRQVSQYRPPLQRSSSRYKADELERPTRTREQEQPPSTSVPRTRGSSRYQLPTAEYTPERTSSLTRTQPQPTADSPTSSRSSSTSHSSTRSRGSQRYAPDAVESVPRTSPRRPPVNAEPITRNAPSAEYIPIEDFIKNEEKLPLHTSRTHNQPPTNLRAESDSEDYIPVRNTLRSRPQYEVRDSEPSPRFEESIEEPNVYNPEYQLPPETNSRTRYNQRQSAPGQQPPEPEYHLTTNRQQNRQESQYQAPQNARSRQQPQYQAPQQPQYQAPQNPRINSRQANNRQTLPNSRTDGRPRHQDEPQATSSRSSSGKSNFKCPDAYGFFGDPVQCDKYYECRNGTAEMNLCSDGLAFNEISAPKFLRCDSLRDVDCKSRSELQEAQPSKNCPRRFGLFPHETDCTKFWNCVDGAATEVQCPPGLTYNDERATCDWADLVETSCKSEDLLGFTCPEPTAHDLQDGVYARYPHPDNCQLHFTCIKGADGLRRPRMLSCNDGQVFDPLSSSCKRPDDVPGCENFYGGRSQAPEKKPANHRARQPEPEPEEIYEDPTPRPRRRGPSRRVRN